MGTESGVTEAARSRTGYFNLLSLSLAGPFWLAASLSDLLSILEKKKKLLLVIRARLINNTSCIFNIGFISPLTTCLGVCEKSASFLSLFLFIPRQLKSVVASLHVTYYMKDDVVVCMQ